MYNYVYFNDVYVHIDSLSSINIYLSMFHQRVTIHLHMICVGVRVPSKHDTFRQCWFHVEPASQTVANIEQTLAEYIVFVGCVCLQKS